MKNHLDLIVTFAKLWGIVTADSRDNEAVVNHLEGYNSEELVNLFTAWSEEYMNIPEADTCDFFDEKMSEILADVHGAIYYACPAGYDIVKLNSIEEMAKCIMEYGAKTDLEIYHKDGTFLCDTFGIYLNKVADMEFREVLLKVLMPMQMAVDGTETMLEFNDEAKPTQTIEHHGNVFEVVDCVPRGYLIWNIGSNMLEGYLPLCRYINSDSSFRIDGNNLKAIKCEGAQVVLKAVGAGYETIEDMRQCIEENANAAFGSIESGDRELCIAAMPYMEELNWEGHNNEG